jgi:dipeptidyl aminopeptidase/acylaminoacyl peptidase
MLSLIAALALLAPPAPATSAQADPSQVSAAPASAALASSVPASSVPASMALARPAAQASSAQAPADVLTPHAVEALSFVSTAAMSPSGTHVAYVVSVPRAAGVGEDGPPWAELHVFDLAVGRSRPFVTGKVNVGSVEWSSDGKSIAYIAKRDPDKHTALWSIALDGGESARLVALAERSISAFSFSPDGSQVALIATDPPSAARKAREDKGFKPQVYEEDLPFARVWIATTSGKGAAPRQLAIEGHVHQVDWSPADTRLAVALAPTPLVDDQYVRQRVRVVDSQDGTTLQQLHNPGKLGDIGWSPDGRWVALISAQDLNDPSAGRFVLWNSGLDRALPLSYAPLPDDWPADVQSFGFLDADTALLVVQRGTESSFERVELTPPARHGGEAPTQAILPAGRLILSGLSLSRDGLRAAFVAHSAAHPPELYTMSHGDAEPVRRTTSNAALASVRLARQEVVRWKARDGQELEGVLIHPLEAQGRSPLIVYVHGGPEAHESNGWLTSYARPGQVAAARGFAVFHPNYRGSTGRGVPFSKLSQGDAAGREFDDLVDGVDSLVARGLVDVAKVGITGGSYGGYATAWCSTRYSERFAAGVMFVGISDKLSKFGTTDIPDEEFYVHALKRPWEAWEFFRERSPISYADRCQTPLLILHGKDDPRVDPGQSRTMYRHLKLRGEAPVRLVLYPGEGHGNRKATSRLDYALRMHQWFAHYLQGPGGAPPPYEIEYAAPAAAPAAGE